MLSRLLGLFDFLFGRRKGEPLGIEAGVDIMASASVIFGLIDFSNPANRLLQRGFSFSEKAEGLGRFAATDPNMPDLRFEFDVDLYEADKAYGFFTRIIADPPFGAFERFREEYHIEAIEAGACRVRLKTKSWRREGLGWAKTRKEELRMARASARDLLKLKMEAEAVTAQEAA